MPTPRGDGAEIGEPFFTRLKRKDKNSFLLSSPFQPLSDIAKNPTAAPHSATFFSGEKGKAAAQLSEKNFVSPRNKKLFLKTRKKKKGKKKPGGEERAEGPGTSETSLCYSLRARGLSPERERELWTNEGPLRRSKGRRGRQTEGWTGGEWRIRRLGGQCSLCFLLCMRSNYVA